MTREEVIVDDNYKHMVYFASISVLDKDDAHTELRIYPITDEYTIDVVIPHIALDIVDILGDD